MVNKKQVLRLGTFLAILMFLLIPLLSSPVAAILNCTGMAVSTSCGPAGLTITVTNPTTTSFNDDGEGTIIVTCTYTFNDVFTTTRTPSSRHNADLIVTPKPAFTSIGTIGTDTSFPVTLNSGQSNGPFTLTATVYYSSSPCEWDIVLDTTIAKLAPGADDYQHSENWDLDV